MTRPHRPAPRPAWAIPIAAVACIALGVAASFATATRVETHEEVQIVDSWTERARFSYEPLLADGNGTLPSGEPGYFTNDAPTLRVRFTWSLDDPTSDKVTALANLRLTIQRAGSPGRPPWTYEEPLASSTLAGNAGDPLVLEGLIDLPRARERALAAPGRDAEGATWTVIARVRFATTPHVSHSADASTFDMPIVHTPPLYALPPLDALTHTKDHTARDIITHAAPAGPNALLARPFGPLMILIGLATLAYGGPTRAPRFPAPPPREAPPEAPPARPSPPTPSAPKRPLVRAASAPPRPRIPAHPILHADAPRHIATPPRHDTSELRALLAAARADWSHHTATLTRRLDERDHAIQELEDLLAHSHTQQHARLDALAEELDDRIATLTRKETENERRWNARLDDLEVRILSNLRRRAAQDLAALPRKR